MFFDEGLPFEIKEGNRKNSKIYVSSCDNEKFAYIRDRPLTLKCRRNQQPKFKDNVSKEIWRENRCYARAKIVNDRIILLQNHNHPEESEELNKLFLKSQMKDGIEEQPLLSTRQIFDETSQSNPTVASQVSFNLYIYLCKKFHLG